VNSIFKHAETGTLVQVLSCKNLGAIVHYLVLDSDADCFKNVHVIGSATMVSVRQQSVTLQAAVEAFMARARTRALKLAQLILTTTTTTTTTTTIVFSRISKYARSA
jgi:hypothetical protein